MPAQSSAKEWCEETPTTPRPFGCGLRVTVIQCGLGQSLPQGNYFILRYGVDNHHEGF